MKIVLMVFAMLLAACSHTTNVLNTEKEETVQVVRLTEERADRFLVRLNEGKGAPCVYADIQFVVEAPKQFDGRRIVLPIIEGTEGPLFKRSRFTIRIPACFLEGKRSAEIKNEDGSTSVTTHDGLGFEGILIEEANQALQHNDPSCHVPCLRTYRASRGRG